MDDITALRTEPEPTPEVTAAHRNQLLAAMGQPPSTTVVELRRAPLPGRHPSRTRRRRLLAVAAVALGVVGAGAVVAKRADPSGVPTMAGTESATRCDGPAFPPTLPDMGAYAGPAEGPAPGSDLAPDEGQQVQHWTSETGSIEVRWPAPAAWFSDEAAVVDAQLAAEQAGNCG